MELLHSDIAKYLIDIVPERDSVLAEMEEYAASKDFPIVGPLVGRLLYVLAKAMKARKVLELGSGFGYSAYWFAKAMGPKGKVICTELSKENASRASEYLRRGKIGGRVKFYVGDALQVSREIPGTFDIIFSDINKEQYPKTLRVVLPRLRRGGLFIADNVLWSGKILDKKPDTATAGILTFTRMLYAHNDLFTTIIPLRDGLSVSIRL
jgi:predicted O-methyltransferase YrrM